MTPEEACEYLDISMDDDLDLVVLEKNYKEKLSAFGNSQVNRTKIDEAYNILCDLYDELYAHEDEKKKHEGLLMKFAVLLAGVFLLSFGGVIYFVYRINTENMQEAKTQKMQLSSQQESMISVDDYNKLLRELDELRNRQEEAQKELERKQEELERRQKEAQSMQENLPADYAALSEQVMPSMVYIATNKGQGSGFFVSRAGDIFTNYHVIDGAEFINVTTKSEQTYSALVKDFDSVRDIALIKINPSRAVPYLTISDTLPQQGEAVLAAGNPRGLTGSVSNGIVSAVRPINNILWVQFTAPVSPGSSGGALVNLKGEVVGMPSMLLADVASQNLNFAVPSTVLKQFMRSAISKSARALPKTSSAQRQDFSYLPETKFVRKDDSYEMYLDIDSIDYDRKTGIAAFVTYWIPTEKGKIPMRKSPDFRIPKGEDVAVCALLYYASFRDNTYLHVRTVNVCTDGSVARDYIKPRNEMVWRSPKKGSRAGILMNEVKRQLRIR